MKNRFSLVVFGLLLTLPIGFVYGQEREIEKTPRVREGRPPMPMQGGPMGEMMRARGLEMMLQVMRDNPKLGRDNDANAWRDDADSRRGNEQDGRCAEAIR